jgi:uncharacterized membrane protein YhaH (DUF805 family)
MYQNDFTFGRMLLAYKRPLKFDGRSTRTELLGYLIISWVLTTIAFYGLLFTGPARETFVVEYSVVRFILWLPMPALAVRRAHDIGRPWYWSLALLLPAFVAWVGRDAVDHIPGLLQISVVLNIVGLVILFWKPDEEANEFGPDPRLDQELTYEGA